MTEIRAIKLPRIHGLKDPNDYEQAGEQNVVIAAIEKATKKPMTALDELDAMELTMEQADELIDAKQIVQNLIVEGHICAICATPNGGKTTILFELSGEMASLGYNVRFIHADVGPGEAKHMIAQAKEAGFRYIPPDLNPDGSKDTGFVMELFQKMIAQRTDLTGCVFVIDTVKKFADMMNKGSVKGLLTVCRKLTALGATIVLLCHTNKHKDADGNFVFEGPGDMRADVDELIYLIPEKQADGSTLVSTDPSKVRACIEPITYEISRDRQVTMKEQYIDTAAAMEEKAALDKDKELITAILKALEAKKIKQTEIIEYVRELFATAGDTRPGEKRIIRVLKQYTRGTCRQWYRQSGFEKNAIFYSLEPLQ